MKPKNCFLELTEAQESNASLFLAAGSETTATLLTGLTYHLTNNPDKLQKLVDEIRAEFEDESQITMERLANLKYLNACLEEGLRVSGRCGLISNG
jgi:cytochrome P450